MSVLADEPKKATLAVLPFSSSGDVKEKKLAERMRFAVSQKLSNDGDFGSGPGAAFERLDNLKVEETISALGIPWEAGGADEEELAKLLTTLGTDKTIAGSVKGRTLTLTLYEGAKLTKTASVDIPPDKESPKLAVEKVLADLTGAKFARMRTVEADHSDPAAEKRFAERPNLVTDPGFDDGNDKATAWEAVLGPDSYPPPVLDANAAKTLPPDKVAVVPKSLVTPDTQGRCLVMHMSKHTAENNGLACVSTWIPVEAGKKYRFTCRYSSQGPVARLFLKGFAHKPDQYGDKNNPEAARREYYRAQIQERGKTKPGQWDLIEMDFTPSSLKPTDPKIEWLRLDLYVYLTPGLIFFDDITLKKLDE